MQRRAFDELACLNARPQSLADAVNVALAAVNPLRHHGYEPSGRAVWVGGPGWGPRALSRGRVAVRAFAVRAFAPSPRPFSLRALPAAGANSRETCERRVIMIALLRGGALAGCDSRRRRPFALHLPDRLHEMRILATPCVGCVQTDQ